MINGAAVRKQGGLRFLVKDLPKRPIAAAALWCFFCLGICLFGCSARRAEPVLEVYGGEAGAGAQYREAAPAAVKPPGNTGGDEAPGAAEEHPAAENAGNAGNAGGSAAEDHGGNAAGAAGGGAAEDHGGNAAGAAEPLTIHVCGAVNEEGVYTLPAGSRIRDAVDAAGGFSEEADTAALNLAAPLEDAWQIRVPTKEEADRIRALAEAEGGTAGAASFAEAQGRDGAPASGRININTADKAGLMKIPGVGESKAQKIMEYRTENGRFETVEELMKVPGIKKATFEKMRDYVTVGDSG